LVKCYWVQFHDGDTIRVDMRNGALVLERVADAVPTDRA
jgi:hypothetical protein